MVLNAQQDKNKSWIECYQCNGTGKDDNDPMKEDYCCLCQGEGGWYAKELPTTDPT